jgi:8-oxo-dGTP pyrophosphatase MutT (NUDIX family)
MKANDLVLETKLGAGCLLFVPETKKFLLIKRSNFVNTPLRWCLPGGSVERGEEPEKAAIRECWEETGHKILNPLHLVYTNETHAPRFKFYTYASLVDKPFEPKLNWESCDHAWHTIDYLPSPLHWGVHQLFNSEQAAKKLKKLVDAALLP